MLRDMSYQDRLEFLQQLALYNPEANQLLLRLNRKVEHYRSLRVAFVKNRYLLEDVETSYLLIDEARRLVLNQSLLDRYLRQELESLLNINDYVMEITGGIGGREADLFAEEMIKVYQDYLSMMRGKAVQVLRVGKTLQIRLNRDDYMGLMYESGVHRVQRIPVTSPQKKMHTSTILVLIKPVYIDQRMVDMSVVEISNMRSSGPGGQNVNKTSSAVRATHLPSGISVRAEDSREQSQNRELALSRLFERINQEYNSIINSRLKLGHIDLDRGEKIRTYNYPSNRLVDHRVQLQVHNLTKVLSQPEEWGKFICSVRERIASR